MEWQATLQVKCPPALQLRANPNVRILEEHMAIDLLTQRKIDSLTLSFDSGNSIAQRTYAATPFHGQCQDGQTKALLSKEHVCQPTCVSLNAREAWGLPVRWCERPFSPSAHVWCPQQQHRRRGPRRLRRGVRAGRGEQHGGGGVRRSDVPGDGRRGAGVLLHQLPRHGDWRRHCDVLPVCVGIRRRWRALVVFGTFISNGNAHLRIFITGFRNGVVDKFVGLASFPCQACPRAEFAFKHLPLCEVVVQNLNPLPK